MLYFALQIVSWSEQAYKSNFDQKSYSANSPNFYMCLKEQW